MKIVEVLEVLSQMCQTVSKFVFRDYVLKLILYLDLRKKLLTKQFKRNMKIKHKKRKEII
jgi:hypothetical protein